MAGRSATKGKAPRQQREPGSVFARIMHERSQARGGTNAVAEYRQELEADWEKWVTTLFRRHFVDEEDRLLGFAPHHAAFYEHVWSIRPGDRPTSWFSVWGRGHGKSTNVEVAVASLAARKIKGYCIYVSGNQGQANDHLGNVESMFTEPKFAALYPDLAERRENKFGVASGWTRRRIRTASGFTVDAVGLDTSGVRGRKLEDARPDLIIFDDIDDEADTLDATEKKIKVLTRRILPAGSQDVAVIAVQNLVHSESVFSRVVQGRAGFLQDRIVSGPIPAVEGMEWEEDKATGKITITAGRPTWDGMPIERCEEIIATEGLESFLVERNHEVDQPAGALVYRRSRVDAAFKRGEDVFPDPQATQILSVDPGFAKRACALAIQEKSSDRVEMWKEWSFTECDDDYIGRTLAVHILDWGIEWVYYDAESPELGKAIKVNVHKLARERGVRIRVGFQKVAFGKYKQVAMAVTRWMLQNADEVAWSGAQTEEHRPHYRNSEEYMVRFLPSIFKREMRNYELKPGTDNDPVKDEDHGPDSWHAYAPRHLRRWLKARKEMENATGATTPRSDLIPDDAGAVHIRDGGGIPAGSTFGPRTRGRRG